MHTIRNKENTTIFHMAKKLDTRLVSRALGKRSKTRYETKYTIRLEQLENKDVPSWRLQI